MEDAILYILVVILIGLSAFFSATETAFSSVNRIRLKNYAGEGNKRAVKTLKIAEDFDRALSAILIGNNIVNIASASIGTLIFSNLMGDGPAAVTASTVVMTVVVLIFGEVLPKSLAKENAEKLSLSVTPMLSAVIYILTPFTAMLVGLKKLVTGWFRTENKNPSVTEEELKYIVESIEEEGVLEERESDLVRSALEFDEIEVQEIVTPRVDMITLDVEDSWEEILSLAKESRVSRIPFYEDSIDNIIGLVHVRDILEDEIVHQQHNIRDLLTQCVFVHKTMKLSALLEKLRKEKMTLAIVTDDYGGTMGLVTIEDLVEELVGEIWDEYDDFEEELVKKDDNTYEVSGDYNIYDLMEELDEDNRSFESDYNTVSGWVLEQLEHIPKVGESVVYEDRMRVTVIAMEDQRITKLRVELLPKAIPAENE